MGTLLRDIRQAMSRTDVEAVPEASLDTVRTWLDTWNRAELEVFFDLYEADAVVVTDPSWMEAGPLRGRAAIRAWFEGLRDSWDGRNDVTLGGAFAVGDEVVSRYLWRVRGRASGIEMELDVTCVHTIEDGRFVRQQFFFDHGEALEAVGLTE